MECVKGGHFAETGRFANVAEGPRDSFNDAINLFLVRIHEESVHVATER